MAEADQKQKPSLSHYRQAFADMPTGRRFGLFAVLAMLLGGFVAMLFWLNKPDYQTLFSRMNPADASSVVEQLKELKIPYRLEAEGTTIMVPQASLYEARLAMASAGLPKGSGVGFELFNEVKIGTTDFVQRIQYQRALQGELARTIASFGAVDKVRVHIVMGQESLFVEEEKKPSASVVLGMSGSRKLSPKQIQGIVHLVASAVPELTADRVTVVDDQGNLLYKKETDSAGFPAAMTASQLEYQRTVESAMKSKVQSMLEQVVGLGGAVVQVSTDIDFARTTTTEKLFNPDQVAVRSETRSSEQNKDAAGQPGGSPDQRFDLAQRNATPLQAGGGKGQAQSQRENETTNFEISNTVRQTTTGIGGLKRLSVAVVVDGPYNETTTAEGEVTRSFAPRSQEEMRQLTELVRRAVGYNEQRGDEISVVNVPFALPKDLGTAAAMGWMEYVEKYSNLALNVVLVLLFFLFVVRPLLKYFTSRATEVATETAVVGGGRVPAGARVRQVVVGPGQELPSGTELEGEPDMLEAMSSPRKVTTRDMILALAQQDPEKTTAVLRAWIREL